MSNLFKSDIPLAVRSTVRLPYSLIPGISISSPLFLKAVATIAKQANASDKASDTASASPSSSGEKGKKTDQELGASLCLFTHIYFAQPL